MPRPLDEYRGKRDFARTPEPAPSDAAASARRATFVVHRHAARRLHFDLRLQMGGALCSWAVPKGFSYDPSEKHLAVRTEDHPLEYEAFEGRIPEGEYGAGSMSIWDRGGYTLAVGEDPRVEVATGELKVVFDGHRLRGEWHLVRTGTEPEHWLLFKSRDRYAGPAGDAVCGVDLGAVPRRPLPRSVRRARCASERAPFRDPEWLFEMEFDGRRALLEWSDGQARLRGLRVMPPRVQDAADAMRAERALLDGVLVALDDRGRPARATLDRALADGRLDDVVYYAFDLRGLALRDRKAALRSILAPDAAVLFVDHVVGDGERLVEACATAGVDRVIGKRAASRYGGADDWVRIPVPNDAQAPRVRGTVDTEADDSVDTDPDTDAAAASRRAPSSRAERRVRLTNLGKVYWPADGYTKGELIAWYEQVADLLLPHLRDRPVHMQRFPDGIDGKSFYQRQAKEDTPDWIETVMLPSETHGGPIPHIVCNDRDTLLYLANAGSIDLHPWLSRRDEPDLPDTCVLDLDPKDAPFSDVVRIARELGALLHEVGLRPRLKTSGKTGLHVVVPLVRRYTFEQSRMFAEGVARVACRALPEIATVERALASRGGRVYVDALQNRRGQTVVPPYSVRPVRGATVSAPLHWDELDDDLSPARFTIQTMPARLAELGDLFAPVLEDRQELLDAAEKISERVRRR